MSWQLRFGSFAEFLAALFEVLEESGVRPCILRNYEGFPGANIGSDVDFLILPSQLPRAVRALQSIQGVRIVGYTERLYVANVYVEGIASAPGTRALHVDFNMRLSWKDLPYLPTEAVLAAAISRQAGSLSFLVPSPVHEAITSLLASLLVGGQVKEKYFPRVQQTFTNCRIETIAALLPQFGLEASSRLVDAVIEGDRGKALGYVGWLRSSLVRRSLSRRPARAAAAIAGHYARELAVRLSPKTLETVCILAPEGCGKMEIIDELEPLLRFTAQVVEKHPLKLGQPFAAESPEMERSLDVRRQTPWVLLLSMASLMRWLLKQWFSQFAGKKNLTLRLCGAWCHDLPLNSVRRGRCVPRWFARMVSKLLPSPDLWIMLDTKSAATRSRSRVVLPMEGAQSVQAFRSFVKTKSKHVILDASRPAADVREEAYAAIVDTLAQRADRQLKRRFQF